MKAEDTLRFLDTVIFRDYRMIYNLRLDEEYMNTINTTLNIVLPSGYIYFSIQGLGNKVYRITIYPAKAGTPSNEVLSIIGRTKSIYEATLGYDVLIPLFPIFTGCIEPIMYQGPCFLYDDPSLPADTISIMTYDAYKRLDTYKANKKRLAQYKQMYDGMLRQ